MENNIRTLIIDLINEYDEQGYILTEQIVNKYEKRINNLSNGWTIKERVMKFEDRPDGIAKLKINLNN